MQLLSLVEAIRHADDDRFDTIFPPGVRAVSRVHWTPVAIAARAARFLVERPGTRVLDIGCGPGKFCLVGALTTAGNFTGIEQRESLSDLAGRCIRDLGVRGVAVHHGNVEHLDFSAFDAFYLFNPFEENLDGTLRIDDSVKLSDNLYNRYVRHVARQLARAPIGTRVATYCGACEELALGYDCVVQAPDCSLRFWTKTRDTVRVRPAPRIRRGTAKRADPEPTIPWCADL